MSDMAFELLLDILEEMLLQLVEKGLIDVRRILAAIAKKEAQRQPGG